MQKTIRNLQQLRKRESTQWPNNRQSDSPKEAYHRMSTTLRKSLVDSAVSYMTRNNPVLVFTTSYTTF